jgi:hypothetical protein
MESPSNLGRAHAERCHISQLIIIAGLKGDLRL